MVSRSSLLSRVGRIAIFFVSLTLGVSALGQESYLVSTQDGVVSTYDLATNTFITSTKLAGGSFNMVPSRNPRLAFVSIRSAYYSMLDMTLNREVARIKGVGASSGTLTPDGSLLLAPDFSLNLNIVDAAQLKLIRKVSLKSVQPSGVPGQIVATSKYAYVFPRSASLTPHIAVVDLTTYAVSGIQLPQGAVCRKCGGITPDGSTLVAIDRGYDGKVHVVLISTATNKIIADNVQPTLTSAQGLVVTPDGSDPSKIYGYVVGSNLNGEALAALDLVVNSPTYGMVLPSTQSPVDLSVEEMAINSDGSRIVVVGLPNSSHNVEVFDTNKLFNDPSNARIAEVNVENGTQAESVCIGSFSFTIPNTAPVVSSVSGDITNDAPHSITITGGNFQTGALVRIGSMDRLPANVSGGSSLTVTVPAMAAAGKGLDIVVTNPETNAPPVQQNQSGVLVGKFDILLDPKFQPQTQFATVNADNSFSIYDPVQRMMLNNQGTSNGDFLIYPAFNVDGQELYFLQQKFSWLNYENCCEVLPVNLSDNSIGASIPLPPSSQTISYFEGMDGRLNPSTGKPVVDIMWSGDDLYVGVIDTDPGSPTFHTIIRTFAAGDEANYPYAEVMTVSPDGKFAYLWYDDDSGPNGGYTSNLGVMDLTTGAFAKFSCAALSTSCTQQQVYVTQDGKSLLLMSYRGNRARVRVFDISKPMQPRPLAELAPVPVPGHGFPYVANYQVVGNKLYAIDLNGIIVVFNFDRTAGDFRERGYYLLDPSSTVTAFAFSADGSNLYLSDYVNDQVLVFATEKLASGKDAEVTALRSPWGPDVIGVSPVPPAFRAATPANAQSSQQRQSRISTSKTPSDGVRPSQTDQQ